MIKKYRDKKFQSKTLSNNTKEIKRRLKLYFHNKINTLSEDETAKEFEDTYKDYN